jgi:hypothetical protein
MPDATDEALALCLEVALLRRRLIERTDLLEEGLTLHAVLCELAALTGSLMEHAGGGSPPVEGGPLPLDDCLGAIQGLLQLGDPEVTEMTLAALGEARVPLEQGDPGRR